MVTTVALIVVTFTAGCSDEGMGVADGKKAANEARQPVGSTYWKVSNSLGGQVYTTYGTGVFEKCPDQNAKDSLIYVIDEPFEGKSKHQTDDQFVAMVKDQLSSVGWNLKSVDSKTQAAEKGGIKVQLRLLHRTAGDGVAARLVVQGKCTKVGQARNKIIDYYTGTEGDEYRSSSASPTPVPTTFPDPHAAS